MMDRWTQSRYLLLCACGKKLEIAIYRSRFYTANCPHCNSVLDILWRDEQCSKLS